MAVKLFLCSAHEDEELFRQLKEHLGALQRAENQDEALRFFPLAFGLLPSYPELAIAFHKAFAQVDAFLLHA